MSHSRRFSVICGIPGVLQIAYVACAQICLSRDTVVTRFRHAGNRASREPAHRDEAVAEPMSALGQGVKAAREGIVLQGVQDNAFTRGRGGLGDSFGGSMVSS